MKQWYLYYTTEASKLQRPVAELKGEKLQSPVGEFVKQSVSEIGNKVSDEFPLPFALVPNFSTYLPEPQSRLVNEVLKENYNFGFATVEHEPFEERELEDALTSDGFGVSLQKPWSIVTEAL